MNSTSSIIQYKKLELSFLEYFHAAGYNPVDLDLIETFDYRELSQDDLSSMPHRSVWQVNQLLYTLRSDWTDAIRRYMKKYRTDFDKVVYAGPIIRHHDSINQLGIEVFDETAFTDSFELLYAFLNQSFSTPLKMAVIGCYSLLDLMVDSADAETLELISDRHINELKDKLGDQHPVIQLLTLPPRQQLPYLEAQFGDAREVQLLKQWSQIFASYGIDYIHIDITAQSELSYYDSLFFQLYAEEMNKPLVTGGYYCTTSKALGFAIHPENGVMIC